MGLAEYNKKRNFSVTPEPSGRAAKSAAKKKAGGGAGPLFVVQEHKASHLHYDFRLEAFGVLKSWAVPKGPSVKVGEKRLAVETEDHPLEYAKFHGTIPKGEYGAGVMKIWDRGTWVPPKDLKAQLDKGHLEIELKGRKLKGRWLLQRSGKKEDSSSKASWLLIKRHDEKERGVAKPAKLPGKKKADPMPEAVSPQLALLVDHVPKGDRYIHEIKLDGYRTIAIVQGKSVQLLTRNGHDWTDKYSPLDKDFLKLKAKSAILDGEIVALNDKNHSDFSALQAALKYNSMDRVVFYAFDLLYVNGEDLRSQPLEVRKQALKTLLKESRCEKVIFNEHVRGQGEELLEQASRDGLEGIVSKDRNLPYTSGRSGAWQKIKTSLRQELVIGGYTEPGGSRQGLGALLMGAYEDGKLRYVGKVGTGFKDDTLLDLTSQLEKLKSESSPFELAPPPRSRKTHWVKPKLVAEIEFKAWTGDGNLRHASFQGLRGDKRAKDVVAEKATSLKASADSGSGSAAGSKLGSGFRITHPERLIYPDAKIKKIDVANYYKSVAPWMLPHVANRPLSLLRCPDHAGEDCFFQKHADNAALTALNEDIVRDQKVVSIDSEEGLLQLVQWGVLEPHTWQCHIDRALNPDQMIFDLDPDEGVTWKQVVQTAYRLKDLLEDLELKSFVKTTGGKGLHLHVPVEPLYSWEQIKSFSKAVCQLMEEKYPGHYTTNLLKKTRKNKIFLDYLRNGFGATAVAPFSLRSRAKPTVAVPIAWSELKTLKSGAAFDFNSTLARLASQKRDPWEGYEKVRQRVPLAAGN